MIPTTTSKAIMSWQNISAAGRQIVKSDPHRAYALYKMAIAECREVNGANSLELVSLFNDIALICTVLDRSTEARDYQQRCASIKLAFQNISALGGIN